MSLVFEQKVSDGPACHAFIIGSSDYPHITTGPARQFGFLPLSSAALSAERICRWLQNAMLAAPLGSVRLLLSPGVDEPVQTQAAPCTLANFLQDAYDWRQAASRRRDNMTFFYFAGHGFAPTQGEQLLVLRDFGDGIGPLLRNTVSLNNIVYGMAPDSSPEIARTQLYFVDASRARPMALAQYQVLNSTAVFDAPLQGLDDRTAPIFYASAPDAVAFARVRGQTLFSEALIEGLDGAAAEPTSDDRWGVSVLSLARYLPRRVLDTARTEAVDQTVGVEGALGNAIITYLDGPPKVPVTIDVFGTTPDDFADVVVTDSEGQPVGAWKSIGPPHTLQLPAGLYQLELTGTQGGTPYTRRKMFVANPQLNIIRVKP
jgi:hypothetical protein